MGSITILVDACFCGNKKVRFLTIMIQGTSIIQHAMMGTSILRCAMVLIYIQRLPLYLQEWI